MTAWCAGGKNVKNYYDFNLFDSEWYFPKNLPTRREDLLHRKRIKALLSHKCDVYDIARRKMSLSPPAEGKLRWFQRHFAHL